MKNSHTFLLYGVIAVLVIGLFTSLIYPSKHSVTPHFVKINRDICEYHDKKKIDCRWKTERMHKIVAYYQDTLKGGKIRKFAVVVDTISDSHKVILREFLVKE